ncbi:MAG: exopolysaccharide biosynthesis polyprenyl glycosylphosphotransferase, partial [Verrucomicrobiales bacterium]|nr:exopolysaccharide biosynthesis polyprenyl glycosylphosphotransferase [Verrucomicrobiales bacterium]
VIASAGTFACLSYISGLYSRHGFAGSGPGRAIRVFLCLIGALVIILSIGSLNFSARVGRGVLLVGIPLASTLVAIHHIGLYRSLSRTRLRVACLVSDAIDERSAALFLSIGATKPRLAGLVTTAGYSPTGNLPVFGELSPSLSTSPPFDTLLVRDSHLADPETAPAIRRLRYAGIAITSLADACEDVFLAAPLELVTENWLARASWHPGLFYVKKFKRAFDIIIAIALAASLSPALLFGIFLVRISSRGPVFFTQFRCGRLEREFKIYKLRTMRTDAEASGAQWSTSGRDPRVIFAGAFLRKFRIDELPQLLNILKGDMSFVGPRPERPEFVRQLSAEIPHYHERSLVQPGLTGWAQVRYPYGASVEDARRKLEYDLYYLKHMSIVLDLFIILDTIRTILRGGAVDSSQPLETIRSQLRNQSPEPNTRGSASGSTATSESAFN